MLNPVQDKNSKAWTGGRLDEPLWPPAVQKAIGGGKIRLQRIILYLFFECWRAVRCSRKFYVDPLKLDEMGNISRAIVIMPGQTNAPEQYRL